MTTNPRLMRTLAVLALALGLWAGSGALVAAHAAASCPASLDPGKPDYRNLKLVGCNFAGADLRNALFTGATLIDVVFIRADLWNADFSGATFAAGSPAGLATDFTFAGLGMAKFNGAKFDSLTYFTYASLICTDFSGTVLDQGNAVFGDQPLKIDPAADCRTAFRGSTMNCEFIDQWDQLDLTGAVIGACAGTLRSATRKTPFDFSGGLYAGVVFDTLDLAGTKWTGAVLDGASFQGATLDNAVGLNGTPGAPARLSGAKFNRASVRNVDMSNALLYGANFTSANLSGSTLAGAFLTSDPTASPPIVKAAVFDGAHLKDVSLANARLSGASFNYASLYSTFGGAAPSFPCRRPAPGQCGAPDYTCQCATASGADLTGTQFGNAYLYGVDFTGGTTNVNGTQFDSAILVGASFTGARFGVDAGSTPDFTKALLQGTVFDSTANLNGSSLLNAFLDFGTAANPSQGNALYLKLSFDYTDFNGWKGAASPCVQTAYLNFSAPPTTASLTCPNGNSGVCGPPRPGPGANPTWASADLLAANLPVPGWYLADATYEKASSSRPGTCNGRPVDPNW